MNEWKIVVAGSDAQIETPIDPPDYIKNGQAVWKKSGSWDIDLSGYGEAYWQISLYHGDTLIGPYMGAIVNRGVLTILIEKPIPIVNDWHQDNWPVHALCAAAAKARGILQYVVALDQYGYAFCDNCKKEFTSSADYHSHMYDSIRPVYC